MKVKIIVDSSTSLTQEQANSLGWGFIPILVQVNEKTYEVGVDFNLEFHKKVWDNNRREKLKTSASLPGRVQEEVNKYINDFDKIVIYPLSRELSSQCHMIKMMYADNDKVFVVESRKVSYLMTLDLFRFENLMNERVKFEEACKVFDEPTDKVLLIPEFNDALVAGGRLTKAAAAVAKLFKIVPVIKLENGFLDKESLSRVFPKTIVKKAKELFENSKHKNDPNYEFVLVDALNNNVETYIKQIKEILPIDKIRYIKMGSDITIHTGIGAISLSYIKVEESIRDRMDKFSKIV
ncbi:DegV family protein with EDD domain [Metamycoplasma subdolum]|uniref:DegV family protein with EDD domain n=1 Tax=Metamycoplasma subdolum TaxID=92407 RepID=A0A3M0AED8_9BACT|nr:DegV family protein [Metamycoplasma subdolum]RMA77542.1 DegV family protein with EDD domain [Metamycoplasma subdolum]WPB50734.1 DegV family protein [Metamycoplasma subdolum]